MDILIARGLDRFTSEPAVDPTERLGAGGFSDYFTLIDRATRTCEVPLCAPHIYTYPITITDIVHTAAGSALIERPVYKLPPHPALPA